MLTFELAIKRERQCSADDGGSVSDNRAHTTEGNGTDDAIKPVTI